MAHLNGRTLTKQELSAYCGDLSQIAGIRFMTLGDGAEGGVRIADVRSGSGLRFQVSLDRGMDISMAEIVSLHRHASGKGHQEGTVELEFAEGGMSIRFR